MPAVRSLGVSRAHFVGHSMGTMVCQHIAARQPGRWSRSLTLFGADRSSRRMPPRERLRERAAARAPRAA